MATPDGFVSVVKVCTLLTALQLEASVFLTPVISGFGGIRSLHESGSTTQGLHFLLAFHPFNIPVQFG
jgi:hypothetical protein